MDIDLQPAFDSHQYEDYMKSSMAQYKRNQVEEAIFRTLGARNARIDELKFRVKRLLVTDRRLDRNPNSDEEEHQNYAFFSQKPPGSGIEVMFSAYEAFALLAAIMLLEHGFPQLSVVKVMRQVRGKFEAAHAQTLKKDPGTLFDQKAIRAQAKPGMIATDNTDPVFLVFVRLTDSSVDTQTGGSAVAVCRGRDELDAFIRKHSAPGVGATFFEFVSLMHALAANLSQTRPVKRGRGAT
jgi:hypothetical protein